MAGFIFVKICLFFSLKVEQSQKRRFFFFFCKIWVFLMLGNHCNGATDLKTEFETEELVKEKQRNSFDDQNVFLTFLSLYKTFTMQV